jgi:hypothetical protein
VKPVKTTREWGVRWVPRWVSRWALALAALAAVVLGPATGCVVEEDIADGTREMRGGLTSLVIEGSPDGAPVLRFNFIYLLGVVDEAGIASVDWDVTLRTQDQQIVARLTQVMREPDPEQTKVLVVGERRRDILLPANTLRAGDGYILWFVMKYRGEILGEFLEPVYAISGEQVTEPYDPESEI